MIHDVHLVTTLLLVAVILVPLGVIFATKSVVLTIAAAIVLAVTGGLWLLTRSPIGTVVGLIALMFLQWAIVPTGKVPHFRVQTIKLRLRLRLHPGRGFATAFAIWAHWGRGSSFWASKRTRPGLTLWQRLSRPSFHSMFLGRAQYRLGMRLPIQEHLVVFGPPRAYKSGFFSRVIANYMGAVVSTSTKGDMVALTAGIRQHRGSQIYVFNPQRLGPFSSNIRWNLVRGCAEPSVAIRRAQALCEATSTKGTEEATFWSEQASMQMRCLLCAADLLGEDFRIVNFWILSGRTQVAEDKLKQAGYDDWAAVLEQMRSGKAERTTATIRLVLSSAAQFMADPALAECVTPGPGDAFDIEAFLLEAGSLYLIGEQRGENSPIAPLFAGLVTEIQFMAQQMAAQMYGQRLDPPVLFALDEVTQIVPIPLPSILADSGGRGIQIIVAAHGLAQLRERWGDNGAQTVIDTCNLMCNPGIKNVKTLELAEELAGQEWFKVPGSEERRQLPIIPREAIRQLPPKRSLLIRSWQAPVALRLAMGWRDWRYLVARIRGYATPSLIAIPALGKIPGRAARAPMPDMEPNVPTGGRHPDPDYADDGAEATPAGTATGRAPWPAANSGPSGNGHGAANGHRPGSANGHGPGGPDQPHNGSTAASDPWSEQP